MARDYGKVSPRFWTGETGRKLRKHPAAQTLALYLITAPGSTMTGIYYLAIPTAAHETGLTIQQVTAALEVLAEIDFAHYDEPNELVWVPSMAAWQIDDKLVATDKRVLGVKKEILFHQNHPFVVEFWRVYGEAYCLGPCPFPGAMRGLSDPMIPHAKDLTKALGKVLQSQEQDQEQEQENPPPAGAPDPSTSGPADVDAFNQGMRSALSEGGGAGTPMTQDALLGLWKRARDEETGTKSGPGTGGFGIKPERIRDGYELVVGEPDGPSLVERSMRRFWQRVKGGAHPKAAECARQTGMAWACWMADFPGDVLSARGAVPQVARREPNGAGRATGPPRDVRHGHARAEDSKHTKTGEVKL